MRIKALQLTGRQPLDLPGVPAAGRRRGSKRDFSTNIRGNNGFGYDPIFIPNEGDGRTFGEMSDIEKNNLSHRSRAFKSLGMWLTQ